MSKLKDKLSASVRQAKAAQQPRKPQAAAKAAPAPVKSQAAAKAAPAAVKPQAQPARQEKTQKPAATSANVVRDSGTALFPQRIWPD